MDPARNAAPGPGCIVRYQPKKAPRGAWADREGEEFLVLAADAESGTVALWEPGRFGGPGAPFFVALESVEVVARPQRKSRR